MDKAIAEEIYAACERAMAELSIAEKAIGKIDDPQERGTLLRGLGLAIGEILCSVRAPAVHQYPEIEPEPELGPPDTALAPDEIAIASQLSMEDIAAIDSALIGQCAQSWRKVARIVGSAMSAIPEKLDHVPDGYFAQRVIALASSGQLESQGNLHYMRFSEVRLPA
jgi:Protein of unknown function